MEVNMGHYDNCRPGHCAICGQTGNLCGHGKDKINSDPDAQKKRPASAASLEGNKMMDAKEQYIALRAERHGLVLDQIAFYAPDASAERSIKQQLGLADADWTEDLVTGRVTVFGEPENISKARLLFNYDLGIELEILTYLQGPNWHRHRANNHNGPACRPGFPPFMSHIGFHVNDGPLPTLPWPIAQRMTTTFHTNPGVGDRRYGYVIYDTRGTLGVDLKYIKRLS
jgi:hypothetical protein